MILKKINYGVILFMLFLSACNGKYEPVDTASDYSADSVSGNLIIFHAGSLSVPLKEIGEAFNKEYPDVHLIMEAAGSRQCARKITDLSRPCDIMASADYAVIDNLLIPDHADWNIRFATNEMTITYSERSRLSDTLNVQNWFEILLSDSVAFGRSDPNSDPCGYRAVLMLKLAEQYYNRPELAEKLLRKDLNCIRPKEVDLLALLESGSIDYIFLYRSVAEQHKLKYLVLPDEINLKNPEYAGRYASVTCEITGKKPGEIVEQTGEPMVYGITVCKQAPNPDAAYKFVEFILTKDKGIAILEKNGQPCIAPVCTDSCEALPGSLKKLVIAQ
ncbi:MAG: tungstate ABC transporter substrate-binding protein WtpA [Bacteroidetes bacterium]|nr:tungstate ABC transporter substrate-binding protein WtpA [Bacteroidota bacterium]